MLDAKFQRGFTDDKLADTKESRIRKDDVGFFLMSLSENTKVYFEDYYRFLGMVYSRCLEERASLDEKIAATAPDSVETLAYYRARGVIVDLVLQSVRRFYTDGSNLGVVMTPWCFGTVMLEKVEVYRDRLGKGEVRDANVPEFPYYVIQYIDEIYKATLLELFDFPEKAFRMRWQYSELLKKYSKILTNITNSLNSVLGMVRNYGS
ncbi:MAG: hypothetical protein OEV49_03725 [candidate division Zixibacteria bacterium]|nr:hypothetical protein [candidate division Zixibacteria bacterium]MDH3936842.1 hypothetical protein [candidate division Zixibacteria bacterium]MDH4033135.1 hypothetical protein [candidate division Zixibacteria bacterium]